MWNTSRASHPSADATAPSTAGIGTSAPETVIDSGTRVAARPVGLPVAQRDHRDVRDREREQRPERVDPDEELEVGGSTSRGGGGRGDSMITYGVP